MKKVLGGILAALILLGGWIFYQRQKVAGALQELQQGKSYSSYGIVLSIPPSAGKVSGWLRPHVRLDRVILDLTAWGLQAPMQWEGAVAFQDLWTRGALIVEVPRSLELPQGGVLSRPFAELGLKNDIKVLGAEALTLPILRTIHLEGLRMVLGPVLGTLPDLLSLQVGGLGWKEPGKSPTAIQLEAIDLALESKNSNEEREWKIFLQSKGGMLRSPKGEGSIHPLEFYLLGRVKEFPPASVLEVFKSEDPARQIVALFKNWQLKIDSKELHWEGLSLLGPDGEERLNLDPFSLRAVNQESGGNLHYETEGEMRSLRALWREKIPLEMKDLHVSQEGAYLGMNFTQYWENYLKALSVLKRNDAASLWPSLLALAPDQNTLHLGAAQLNYVTSRSQASHRELKLKFFWGESEAGLDLSDQFDFKFLTGNTPGVEDGRARFSLTGMFPWGSLIQSSRQGSWDASDSLHRRDLGLALHFFLDLGKNYFSVETTCRLGIPLEILLQKVGSPPQGSDPKLWKAWWEKLFHEAPPGMVQKGNLSFRLQIERLVKFQGLLEKFRPGTSLGLALLAPYLKIDPKADTLSTDVELKDGQVLINGRVQPGFTRLLGPYFNKQF